MRRILKERKGRPGPAVRRLVVTTVALGLVSWGLMLLPPVNDAVLGDLPRGLEDFARMCEDGDNSGEPFPRAASYEPGPHPWVVIKDGQDAHSSRGTETKEPDTKIDCQYSDRIGSGGATVEFTQGLYTIAVSEACPADLAGRGTPGGDDEVECWQFVSAARTAPVYTPGWDPYADLPTALSTEGAAGTQQQGPIGAP